MPALRRTRGPVWYAPCSTQKHHLQSVRAESRDQGMRLRQAQQLHALTAPSPSPPPSSHIISQERLCHEQDATQCSSASFQQVGNKAHMRKVVQARALVDLAPMPSMQLNSFSHHISHLSLLWVEKSLASATFALLHIRGNTAVCRRRGNAACWTRYTPPAYKAALTAEQ